MRQRGYEAEETKGRKESDIYVHFMALHQISVIRAGSHYRKGIHDKILSDACTRILSLSRIGSCKIILSYAGLWPQSCLMQDQNPVEQQNFVLLSPVILSFPGGILHVGRQNHVNKNKQMVVIG